jgi:hypothetical protein
MSLLNSIALWGLLAISIPILIHLWNGKRGKTIAWAAMDFLTDAENRVSNGIKLENWLVLVLRILVIGLLVLILAQLFWNRSAIAQEKKIAHVLHGEKALWEEFRFEIQQALEIEELVVASGNPPKAVQDFESLFTMENTSERNLQTALDQLPVDLDSLILYLPNSNLELAADFYSTPLVPNLKISSQEASATQSNSIQTKAGFFYQVNDLGLLESQSLEGGSKADLDFSQQSIAYVIQNSAEERPFIEAALESISEVYSFEFRETENMDSASVIFSNRQISNSDPKKLYFHTNTLGYSESENQISFPDSWTFEDSEEIRNGQLPELILESYLAFIGVEKNPNPINSNDLSQRFLLKDKKTSNQKANLNEWLLMLFLGTLILERYLAFKQGI